jgi:tRNA(adenine34) deaminase
MAANSPMARALELAKAAAEAGEVPVGAVIVCEGEIVAEGRNAMRALGDPTAHAEMLAIRAALEKLGSDRLGDCDLYVTLEPCTMCAGAIAHARLRRVYYGAADIKGGAVENGVRFFSSPTCHHRPEVVSGVSEQASAELLRTFFSSRR